MNAADPNLETADLAATAAYRYKLPADRIALAPVEPPDAARLLVAGDPARGLEHRHFRDLPALLVPGDVLVVNETRVVKARLRGMREPGGGTAEVLLLEPAGAGPFDLHAHRWLALVRPGRRLQAGARIRFGDAGVAVVSAVLPDGRRELDFALTVPLDEVLERFGELPLPPYVGPGDAARAARYQSIFARVPGSVAAPTASLHFTPALLARLRERGVTLAPLVLDIGIGTFRPIATERLGDHTMHAEAYDIPAGTASAVNRAKREGRRVICGGTTALRALEAAALRAAEDGGAAAGEGVPAGAGRATLFITPGFRFRVADALITNFHLPASTLLVLVSAFGGYRLVREAYASAIERGYRFYSFGDAMLLSRNGGAG